MKEEDIKNMILNVINKHAEVLLGKCLRLQKNPMFSTQSESVIETEIKEIQQKLCKRRNYLQSLYENLISKVIDGSEFVQLKAKYETEIHTLTEQAYAIQDERKALHGKANKYLDLAEQIAAITSPAELTAEFIDTLIDKIIIKSDKSIDISFRFENEFDKVSEVQKCVNM